jgi:hypothetical protein
LFLWGIAVELLPCREGLTPAPLAQHGVGVVHCEGCGKHLRRRRALTPEQRAQALAVRRAAAEIENDPVVFIVRRRRRSREELDELYGRGNLAAADQLREWAHHAQPSTHQRVRRQLIETRYGVPTAGGLRLWRPNPDEVAHLVLDGRIPDPRPLPDEEIELVLSSRRPLSGIARSSIDAPLTHALIPPGQLRQRCLDGLRHQA